MNEDSDKVMTEVATRNEIKLNIPVVSVRVNWEDKIIGFFKKIFGGKKNENSTDS